MEGQRESALVAAARAADTMDQRRRRLTLEPGPCLGAEDALDLDLVRQGMKQGLDKPEADSAGIGNQLERRYVHVVGTDLAVADDAVAGKLETGETELGNAHRQRSLID